jgi:hypothetical protein
VSQNNGQWHQRWTVVIQTGNDELKKLVLSRNGVSALTESQAVLDCDNDERKKPEKESC